MEQKNGNQKIRLEPIELYLSKKNKMKLISQIKWVFILFGFVAMAQKTKFEPIKIDSLYREDQFYFRTTYNSIQEKPIGVNTDKLSYGFGLGMLRDMPINKNRNVGFAAGLGLTYNYFNQNMAVVSVDGKPKYQIANLGAGGSSNHFSQMTLDFPVEFRWRSSTFESYQFYRFHLGFQTSYLIWSESLYDDGVSRNIVKSNPDFDKLQYGVYTDFGYNTWNFHVYYGLNSLFKGGSLNEKPIEMRLLTLGVTFFIL